MLLPCHISGYNGVFGGLARLSSKARVLRSYAKGNVIIHYSDRDVNHSQGVGGLIGIDDQGIIIDSYSTGNVKGFVVGRLIGEANQTIIESSYSSK